MDELVRALERIAAALERAGPQPLPGPAALAGADAFVWHADPPALEPVASVAALPPDLLRAIDAQKTLLLDNTHRFAAGEPANNALLWGARGMGKSSLVKAAHRAANQARPGALALVEIGRDELHGLPTLLAIARRSPRRVIVFCDDLSFDPGQTDYKSLKSVLEGGIAGRPENVLFYATSNRRHLLAREAIENERSSAINPGDAVEEKVSLADRFGLSLGFHGCSQAEYLAMVEAHAAARGRRMPVERLRAEAIAWAMGRGSRSGRVAVQFVASLPRED